MGGIYRCLSLTHFFILCFIVESHCCSCSRLLFQVQSWVRTIIPGVVTPTLFLFGAPANIVCAMVFYKQSLKERINVCLFALALTDFIALTVDFLLAAEHIYRTFIAPSTILLECLVGMLSIQSFLK